MAEFHDSTSFLKGAGVYQGFLDINNLPKISASIADKLYQIEPRFDQRPDLLAFELYGTTRLWWLFALRNVDIIQDPIRDFRHGIQIYLPPKTIIEGFRG